MVFFNRDWTDIGTKSTLAPLIESITGIHSLRNFRSACVAQKMSWAAKRVTTRLEDRAYSLMGLFDVNMPLIYGEGKKAFYRLQIEILNQSSDYSLFAWIGTSSLSHTYTLGHRTSEPYSEDPRTSGLLAHDLSCFSASGNIFEWPGINLDLSDPPTMTSRGMRVSLQVPADRVNWHFDSQPGDKQCTGEIMPLPLHCCRPTRDGVNRMICLYLTDTLEYGLQRYYGQLFEMNRDEVYQYYRGRSTTEYIEQGSNYDFRILRKHLLMDFTDLLQRGFVVSEVDQYFTCEKSCGPPLWFQGEWSEIDPGRLIARIPLTETFEPTTTRLHTRVYICKSSQSPLEQFGLVLEADQHQIGLNILVPSEDGTWETESHPPNWDASFPNRMSVALNSGRSVSAVIKRRPLGSGAWVDRLCVTIHDDGKLHWPILPRC